MGAELFERHSRGITLTAAGEARSDELDLLMSATESHNLSNPRMTREQCFNRLKQVAGIARCQSRGQHLAVMRIRVPMEGDIAAAIVLEWTQRVIEEAGAQGVTLCGTTGMAFAQQVAALTALCVER